LGDGPRPAAPSRIAGVDALRGGALCLMFVYHFSFDLRYYKVIAADFENDPFWLGFRALIVASFMTLVGISLVLAHRAGSTPAHFWKRIGVITGCAIAASVGSFVVFPRTFIYFGILHCIAVASILAWPLVRWPRPWGSACSDRRRGRVFASRIRRAGAVVARLHNA
jgi:uncharacterized membrane protein